MEQKIEDLSSDEWRWLAGQLESAADLAKAYVGSTDALPSLDTLGVTFAAWAKAPEGTRQDVSLVVKALGVAFGQHLANDLAFRWVVVTDAQGTDLALHGQPGNMLLFPISSTAKRHETQEYAFFKWLYEMMRERIQQARGGAS